MRAVLPPRNVFECAAPSHPPPPPPLPSGHPWVDTVGYRQFLVNGGVPPWAPFDIKLPGDVVIHSPKKPGPQSKRTTTVSVSDDLVAAVRVGDRVQVGDAFAAELAKKPKPPAVVGKTNRAIRGRITLCDPVPDDLCGKFDNIFSPFEKGKKSHPTRSVMCSTLGPCLLDAGRCLLDAGWCL